MAVQFRAALQRVGYVHPEAKGKDTLPSLEALQWVFDNKDTRPFFAWLADHLHPNNVLTKKELQEYSAASRILTEPRFSRIKPEALRQVALVFSI